MAISGTRKLWAVVVTWTKPPAQQYKLNTDASMVNGRASGGGVLCNSNGRLVFNFYKEFGERRDLQAKELTVLEGLKECATKGIREVMVEVDTNKSKFI